MSVKVHPLLIADNTHMADKVLHFVPDGQEVCEVCRLSKHRMRFFYTNEPEFWALALTQTHLGMVNPSTECVEPFVPCRPPGEPRRDPHMFAANIIAGNFGGPLQ